MMNFTPFGSHFSSAIPTIHQFAAKFTQENFSSSSISASSQEPHNLKYSSNPSSFTQHSLPIQQPTAALGTTAKYSNYSGQHLNIYEQQTASRNEKRENFEEQELAHEICAAVLHHQDKSSNHPKAKQDSLQPGRSHNQQHNSNQHSSAVPPTWQPLPTTSSAVADYLSHLPASLSLHHFLKYSAENIKNDGSLSLLQNNAVVANVGQSSSSTPILNSSNVNSIATSIAVNNLSASISNNFHSVTTNNNNNNNTNKKKKKKKTEKEKKPRPKPGEIRLTTALDGSTLYCCPECHMAYPEKELLEQHLMGHTLERRFVCDICGAGLKRKDHLTRHKQSHNPERPYVCTVCLKAFKRKEQLTLHFVIHSGEKRHICAECGKGFYRKDHLRKHTRSHIARRVKAELSQQGGNAGNNNLMNHNNNQEISS